MAKDQWIALLNVTTLVAIMLTMGLQVKFADVIASARQTRLVVLAVVGNYLLVPAITLLLLYLFHADTLVAIGFLILAVSPGAPFGPPATAVARGNVAMAIAMMVILASLSAILSPVLLSVMLGLVAPDNDFHVDTLAIVRTLVVAQLLPLALGLTIHGRAPNLSARIVKPLSQLANAQLLILVGLILATQYETLSAIRFRGWTGMTILLLASLAIGWLCGGTGLETRKAMAVTTATRNIAVGLVIVGSNFPGTPAVTAVVAFGLLSIVGTLAWGLLSRVIRPSTSKQSPAAVR